MKKFLPKSLNNTQGFTLVELLVVISIIAILALMGIVVYGSVSKNARDSKRQSDLKFIQSAVEDYYSDQLYYPTTGNVTPGSPLTFTNLFTNLTRTYMNSVPRDPTGTREYYYRATPASCNNTSSKCTDYCVFAQMENNNLVSDSACTGLPSEFSSPKAYGITSP